MHEEKHALSQVFAYGDRMVRTAGTIEAPLFVAKDVCACLALGTTGRRWSASQSEKRV
jgi:prophage antirepressor-like protein